MTQKLDDKLLLDIETNFGRTADTTNTNTFPVYSLDNPIHPPLANKELDSKLSRLKISIFSIPRKQKRISQNLSCTQ